MKIVSWNVNGIRAWVKKNGTLDFANRSDVDVLCLNETKINKNSVKEIEDLFSQYPFKHWASSLKKGYAGVAVFSKIPPISSKIGFSQKYDDVGRVITLEFSRFFLVSAYFPNSGSGDEFVLEKREFDNEFREFLAGLMAIKEVVFIGDLNIVQGPLDYFQPKGKKVQMSQTELESFQLFLDMGLVDTFRYINPTLAKFTWFSYKFPQHRLDNKGWRIDYAFVSENAIDWVENSLIHSGVFGSDHVPIELILAIPN